MKLTVLYVLALRCLANGMRAVENKLYWTGCAIQAKMERTADAAYAKAGQLREHANFMDTDYRNEKVEAAVLDVSKEVDLRVAGVHRYADMQDELGNKLNNILSGCK